MNPADPIGRARACFIRACELDVAVRKPGNVSRVSAGHGMQAQMFVDSARAAAVPLFAAGRPVGERIEAAVEASWSAAGCNTNLGIVLLAAPLARAAEAANAAPGGGLRQAVQAVLGALDLADSAAAFRAIAHARPGGLGRAAREDVHAPPTLDLRAAMALAADRDLIARQYVDGYAALFDQGLRALGPGFSLMTDARDEHATAAVQRLYLDLLARFPDSHIVRKHGDGVAQTVMTAAQAWSERAGAGESLDADPGFAAWDESLKALHINPGTTADLTVATLLIAGLIEPG